MTRTIQEEISRWVEFAKQHKKQYILSVCDTFNYEDYPVYCKNKRRLRKLIVEYNNINMQRINEVIHVPRKGEIVRTTDYHQFTLRKPIFIRFRSWLYLQLKNLFIYLVKINGTN